MIPDFHPLLVHFPIALFTVYAAMEVIRLPILTRQTWYFPMKASLVIIGSLMSIITAGAGKIAASRFPPEELPKVLLVHAGFALSVVIIFAILAIAHAIEWTARAGIGQKSATWSKIISIERWIFRTPVLVIGAALGFICLGITGALGSSMVYGPDAEPVSSFIYHLLIR